MTISHLIVLLVRAFAICLAIYSINGFVYSVLLFSGNDNFSILSIGVPASIMLAGILVWFMPYSLAKSLTGHIETFDSEPSLISSNQFAAITFLILALYLSFSVISDISYWLYYYLNFEKYGLTEIGLEAKASIFSTVFETMFLLVMILGRQKVFFYFNKLRS